MQEIICVVCPKGCHLHIDGSVENGSDGIRVAGHSCERGLKYGRDEMLNPLRVLTSTVRVNSSGELRRCPVRTSDSIPKKLLFEAMKVIDAVEVTPPVNVGDVLVADILETGVDVIATRAIK